MANYTADKTAYNAAIDNDISTQTGANTIPPEVVGAGYTDLANLLEPYINAINNQAILSGSTVPSSLIGADLDLYYRSQPTYFELYRKEAGTWVLKVNVPFSVTLPEGNLTVQTSIDGLNVIATKGGWVIANTVYSKATQTGITVAAADLNFYRHDIIYADTLNNIQYLQGTASASPVTPSLPADTILIDEVVVPASSSGFEPYLLYGATIENETTPIRSDTGALTYDGITIASGTTVNIGACTGYVVDNESIPGESSFIFVNYAGETAKTVTTLGSGIATYVLLSGSGTIVFQNTFPTSAQRKTHIYLSKISHPAGTITVAADEPDFVLSPLAQFRDLFQALNYVNDGVYPSANGSNLTVNISAGNIHGNGINFVNDNTNPNDLAVVPSTPATFLPRTRTGAGGAATTTIDVGNYDVAGAVTAIPGGANTSTLKYIFIVPGLGYIVQYGQTVYASLVDAIAAVGKESSHVVYPSLTNNSLLIGVLAATKSATALNDTAQAQFFRADKFGQVIGAQAGVSIGTLQSSYNNSLQPQITTTTALGAVQIKRGSAADTDNVFQVLNAAGTANFNVTGNGLLTVQAGGEALKVGTNTGLSDYAYIGLYARQGSPTTNSAIIGYASAGSTTLLIKNYLTGALQLETATGNISQYAASSVLMTNSAVTASRSYVNTINAVGNVYESTAPVTDLRRMNGTFAAITPVVSGNTLGSYAFSGYQSAASAYISATIKGVSTSSWSTLDSGSKLEFYTTANGTVTQVKALTIDQDGSLVHAGSRSGTATKWLGVDATGKVVDAAFVYDYSETYDVPSLAAGAVDVHTVSIPGCSFGDFVIASMSTPLGYYLTLKAYVSSGGTVDVVFHNTGTGTIDLTSATLKIKVIR